MNNTDDYDLAIRRIEMYEQALENEDPKASTIGNWAVASVEQAARGYDSEVSAEGVANEVQDHIMNNEIEEARDIVNQLEEGEYGDTR